MMIFVVLAVLAIVAAADPEKPALPTQYSVTNIQLHMATNAGYPPKYTETDSAQYYDFDLQKTRTDVKSASYGNPGPYSIISDYSETFPVDCGRDGEYQAPKGYLVEGDQCCFTYLIDNCPAKPDEFPTPKTMYAPVLPQMVKYEGTVNSEIVADGASADLWESNVMLKQSVPFMTQDFYFAESDHTTQLANAMYLLIESNGQFINATTTYADGADGWKLGAQDPSVFDVSKYDCSAQCKSSVSNALYMAPRVTSKLMKAAGVTKPKPAAKSVKAVQGGSCESITDESKCMSSSEGGEACAWCSSGAVGTSCQKESEAKTLPSAVFECEYQTAYAAYVETTPKIAKKAVKASEGDDCSACIDNGKCAQCAACLNMKEGPCAPCWSDDNEAGKACLPACVNCWANSYAPYVTEEKTTIKAVQGGSCESITDESKCMSSSEGGEACAWCSSGAVGTSCQKESEAKTLPSAVFECEYQTAYAAYVETTPKIAKQVSSSAECSTANYLRHAGFPESTIPTMTCISKYESSWSCSATNKNNDGSTDYGLMQINSYYWCSGDPKSKYDECNASCASLMDCQKNANCAYTVYKQQGYNAWYGYKNHKSECDNYTLNC